MRFKSGLSSFCPAQKPYRRIDMKRSTLLSFYGAFLLAVLVGTPGIAHARSCSLTGTAGKYGFTLSGVVIVGTGPVPIAAVGRFTVDAAGNVSGTESRSVGGGFEDE